MYECVCVCVCVCDAVAAACLQLAATYTRTYVYAYIQLQGLALAAAGLQLAAMAGSEATTVMSARQCAMFRRGLAQALEKVNQIIVPMKVQIRRFQVCCVCVCVWCHLCLWN